MKTNHYKLFAIFFFLGCLLAFTRTASAFWIYECGGDVQKWHSRHQTMKRSPVSFPDGNLAASDIQLMEFKWRQIPMAYFEFVDGLDNDPNISFAATDEGGGDGNEIGVVENNVMENLSPGSFAVTYSMNRECSIFDSDDEEITEADILIAQSPPGSWSWVLGLPNDVVPDFVVHVSPGSDVTTFRWDAVMYKVYLRETVRMNWAMPLVWHII